MTLPIVIFKDKIKPHAWAKWMVGRTMRKNQNNLIMIKGKTGSGKTYVALSISQIMEKMDGIPFTIDHVVFSLTELLELVNSGKLRRGSKIVFDEPQASIGARDFMSEANKVFNLLATTFRSKNYTLFFCSPFESLLDKSTRKLFHAVFETESINFKNRTCRIKPRFIEYSSVQDNKVYRKRLIIELRKNKITEYFPVDYWDIPEPSKEMIELYEAKKNKFTDNLNKKLYNRLLKYNEKDMFGEEVDDGRIKLPPGMKATYREVIISMIRNDGNKEMVAKELGITERAVSKRLFNCAENKFYWEQIKNMNIKDSLPKKETK